MLQVSNDQYHLMKAQFDIFKRNVMAERIKSPFKFLDSYTMDDKDVFFGRDKEVDSLYDYVNMNKLVLVYGQSGTGKTSLVQCGLTSRFDITDWYPIFIKRQENINQSFERELRKAAKTSYRDDWVEKHSAG